MHASSVSFFHCVASLDLGGRWLGGPKRGKVEIDSFPASGLLLSPTRQGRFPFLGPSRKKVVFGGVFSDTTLR